ncbi:ARM repeat-containing protein [Wallemia mellicola]|uniref:ARM repeat-containing protein n=1 Tax=Wallemia mellicola TaxID=1708541 RepID=A0A4T0RG58_9BASI|nr:ARM repeat-containing protein [Wallemia mellicola]TIC05073.1 ARM repeat-containing protein [Wallemia mellicola]TIC14981.1 ARM repeat-containing protein [Wallemia mellicola]TIC18278.1 ARM repeat-containing protein [Wallemia mellicola]TIC37062.1 ARM repeat-containing protein [Wallemia mellicola]
MTTTIQKTDAWDISNQLLITNDLPLEIKLFSIQTLRSKIIYDFNQLNDQLRLELKINLFDQLKLQSNNLLIKHLNLTLADLALQFDNWLDPIQDYLNEFGQSNHSILLDFLSTLPEESNNNKLSLSIDQLESRTYALLTNKSSDILQLLSNYSLRSDINLDLLFDCIKSWSFAGEFTPSMLNSTPLLDLLFNSLSNEQLFDKSIDTLSVIIHETQEIHENLTVINIILDKLHSSIQQNDDDTVRNYTRLYSEAGETYLPLFLSNFDQMEPIINSILLCSKYNDLEIVQITFNFWFKLAHALDVKPHLKSQFIPIYSQLIDIIIDHLKFPLDESLQSAQERDEFRSFRHYIGDTLKDCCTVIGPKKSISRSLELILQGISTNSWQYVEAPLFSLRSMGSKVDYENDNDSLESIFNLLPNLPEHPRIRYAGILVASRFTEWINKRPDFIPFYLSFISTGFESNVPDVDIPAAACQALKFICEDCNHHLISYLPQLFQFVQQLTDTKLHEQDHLNISQAIAFVIETIEPKNDQAVIINQFVSPYLVHINDFFSKTESTVNKDDIKSLISNMEQIESYIAFTGPLSPLPVECQSTPFEVYNLLVKVIVNFGGSHSLIERVCGLLRKGLRFFDESAVLPIIPNLLEVLVNAFGSNPLSAYIWLIGKCFNLIPKEKTMISTSFNNISNKLFTILQSKQPSQVPDLIEDYIHLLLQIMDYEPSLIFNDNVIQPIFDLSLTGLNLYNPEAILVSLDFIRDFVDVINDNNSNSNINKTVIAKTLSNHTNIANLIQILLEGLVNSFPEDCVSTVITLIRQLAQFNNNLMKEAIPVVMNQSSLTSVAVTDQQIFIESYTNSMSNCDYNGVRRSLNELYRASRRSRERASLIEN